MVAAPLLPDRPTEPFHRTKRFVAGIDARCVRRPWLATPAHGDDGVGTSRRNRGTTLTGVIGTITTHPGDPLIRWNLRQQIRQCRCIASRVGRNLDRPDLQCLSIDPEVNPSTGSGQACTTDGDRMRRACASSIRLRPSS